MPVTMIVSDNHISNDRLPHCGRVCQEEKPDIHSQIGHDVGQLRAEVDFVSIPVVVARANNAKSFIYEWTSGETC